MKTPGYRVTLRTYRAPIAAAAAMLLALGFWTWKEAYEFQNMEQEGRRRHASGMLESMEGMLQTFGQNAPLQNDRIRDFLGYMGRRSPVRFVVLERDGQRILQEGDVPETLRLETPDGEVVQNDTYIVWRTSLLPNPGSAGGKGSSRQTLVLGLRDAKPPPMGLRGPMGSLALTASVAVLCIGAIALAWGLSIRARVLAARLESERVRTAHLEELGLAAAGLAHETKNPLGIILGLAQRIAANPQEPEESRVMVEHIIDEVDKATERLSSFMTFARQRQANAVPLDARAVLTRVAQVLQPDFDKADVKLAQDIPPLTILADEEMLRQILVNLLLNSLRASPRQSTVTMRIQRVGDSAALTIKDEGSGIAPDLLPDIFKPYVAGNPDGHGLGLAVVNRFVEQHGWTIKVDSEFGRGTTMTIAGIKLSGHQGDEA